MSGHLAFPDILGDLTPASLSPFMLRTVLRERLGFRGMVVTDDMEMEGALNGTRDVAVACRRALEAGNDLLLLSHSPPSQEKVWTALCRGHAPRSRPSGRWWPRPRRACSSRSCASSAPGAARRCTPIPARVADAIPSPGAADFFRQSAARAVTLVAGGRVPWRPARGERVLLCGQLDEFFAEGSRALARQPTPSPSPTSRSTARSRTTSPGCPRRPAGTTRWSSASPTSTASRCSSACDDLGPRLLVISALSPVYLAEVPWVTTAVAVYGSGRDSFRAGFAVLAGEITAAGTMPLSFPPGAAP